MDILLLFHREAEESRHQPEDDLRLRLDASAVKNLLPTDEAPPPYTPPRIINDSQVNSNMSCIAEGNSDEEQEEVAVNPTNQIQSSVVRPKIKQTVSPEASYDTHPAFNRLSRLPPKREDKSQHAVKEMNVHGDLSLRTQSPVRPKTIIVANRNSPQTPPCKYGIACKKIIKTCVTRNRAAR